MVKLNLEEQNISSHYITCCSAYSFPRFATPFEVLWRPLGVRCLKIIRAFGRPGTLWGKDCPNPLTLSVDQTPKILQYLQRPLLLRAGKCRGLIMLCVFVDWLIVIFFIIVFNLLLPSLFFTLRFYYLDFFPSRRPWWYSKQIWNTIIIGPIQLFKLNYTIIIHN